MWNNQVMHERLIRYLKDNRDHIVETWLLEAEVPQLNTCGEMSNASTTGVPLSFLTQAFDSTLKVIKNGQAPKQRTSGIHLDDILGVTCTCKNRTIGGRVCIELHDSGLVAFMSVLNSNWDATSEFNEFDREHFADLIHHALSGVFSNEINQCQYKRFRTDCPFSACAINDSVPSN
jgi:hypothetical protein